jgi:hypothetical protein
MEMMQGLERILQTRAGHHNMTVVWPPGGYFLEDNIEVEPEPAAVAG